jgi:glycosyltransferase involved in cell wall biosynthesis
LRVLIQTRPNIGDGYLTGDVTQVASTANALERLGVNVVFSDSLEPDVSGIDAAHLFSTLQPHYTYLRLRHLLKCGIPTVVSTIYWEWEPEELRQESIFRLGCIGYSLSRLKAILAEKGPQSIRHSLIKSPFPYQMQKLFDKAENEIGLSSMRKYIYEKAHVLLPNSHIEYEYLRGRFGINNDYVAVPNAVAPDVGEGNGDEFKERYGLADFVLCVAGVTIRKNQIRLIRAMRGVGLPLVLVGPEDRYYAAKCQRESDSNVHFLGQLTGPLLKGAFRAAKVHALVSFYETPGLASLEAAIADTSIVVSARGCTKEYFRDDAFYCDPMDVNGIRDAVLQAINAHPSERLKDRILKEYTWDRTAEKTMEGYELAIQKVRCIHTICA